MKIEIWYAPGFIRIRPFGEVDANEAPYLQQAFHEARSIASGRIELDGEHMTYLSSAGLGVLIDAMANGSRQGYKIQLCRISEAIKWVLTLSALTEHFDYSDGNDHLPYYKWRLSQPGRQESVRQAMDFVQEKVSDAAGQRLASTAKLITEELSSNLIRHAFRPGMMQRFAVEVEVPADGNQVLLRILDRAAPYDPTAHRPDPLETLRDVGRKGGLGLRMVLGLAQAVRYRTGPEGNVCEVVLDRRPITEPQRL